MIDYNTKNNTVVSGETYKLSTMTEGQTISEIHCPKQNPMLSAKLFMVFTAHRFNELWQAEKDVCVLNASIILKYWCVLSAARVFLLKFQTDWKNKLKVAFEAKLIFYFISRLMQLILVQIPLLAYMETNIHITRIPRSFYGK